MKILFRKAVFVLDELQYTGLDGFLIVLFERVIADEYVEFFALDDLSGILFELFLREMDEQIRHAEYRIRGILTDADVLNRIVRFNDNAVQGKRQRHPLILLDAAVIMRVHVREAAVFVQRILFDVKATRVNMRTENIHTVFERLVTDIKEHDGFFHVDGINFIARLQRLTCGDDVTEIFVTVRFRNTDCLLDAFTLCFATGKKIAVTGIQRFEFLTFRFRILVPNGRVLFFCHMVLSFLYQTSCKK